MREVRRPVAEPGGRRKGSRTRGRRAYGLRDGRSVRRHTARRLPDAARDGPSGYRDAPSGESGARGSAGR
ncbi:MAG: hypothetical protein DMF83_20200 [Acidobacteria bacterium]|nr:MAG: hypothetical protein DMF83_20200 [Acidobacteriota bacterium]